MHIHLIAIRVHICNIQATWLSINLKHLLYQKFVIMEYRLVLFSNQRFAFSLDPNVVMPWR